MMTLHSFAEFYCLQHDASTNYTNQVRWCVDAFAKYLGREPLLDDLSPETINRWLFQMKADGLATDTRRSRRRMILMLASEAARQRRMEPLSRDLVARIKTQPRMVDGFSYEEAQKLIDRLLHPPMRHRRWLDFVYRHTGIHRGDYWLAYILATWDTGAPADLRLLRFSDIRPDGTVDTLRKKTGKPLQWQLSPATMQAIAEIREPARDLVFPLPGRIEVFRRDAKYVIQHIGGIQRSLGQLRRGAGTDAEIVHGEGAGCKLLGNTQAVFAKHYAIRRLMPRSAVAPRPLLPSLDGRK